jgi:hypothetical protein
MRGTGPPYTFALLQMPDDATRGAGFSVNHASRMADICLRLWEGLHWQGL